MFCDLIVSFCSKLSNLEKNRFFLWEKRVENCWNSDTIEVEIGDVVRNHCDQRR